MASRYLCKAYLIMTSNHRSRCVRLGREGRGPTSDCVTNPEA